MIFISIYDILAMIYYIGSDNMKKRKKNNNKKNIFIIVLLMIITAVISSAVSVTLIKNKINKEQNKKHNELELKSINLFGKNLDIEEGKHVYYISFEDMEIKSPGDLKRVDGSPADGACFGPVMLECYDDDNCNFYNQMSDYDKDEKSFKILILNELTGNKGELSTVRISPTFGEYERYDYYIEITDIDENMIRQAKYCLPSAETE